MNQDPVEQYPDYYAPSAYRSTCIPIMPPSSDSEHGPNFIAKHMTYGRFPWSLGWEQFFPVGGVQGQFLRLKFEHDKGAPDFYNQERILFFITNRLAPEYLLLYKDTECAGLNEVSPVLCAITPHDGLWQLLVDKWPQQQAVLLLRSACGLQELQRHLARLISVEAAGSGRCYFRFYEPAIPEFLFAALEPRQTDQILGPASAWIWPWVLSGSLVEWHGIARLELRGPLLSLFKNEQHPPQFQLRYREKIYAYPGHVEGREVHEPRVLAQGWVQTEQGQEYWLALAGPPLRPLSTITPAIRAHWPLPLSLYDRSTGSYRQRTFNLPASDQTRPDLPDLNSAEPDNSPGYWIKGAV
jgi:hypothetical protein